MEGGREEGREGRREGGRERERGGGERECVCVCHDTFQMYDEGAMVT